MESRVRGKVTTMPKSLADLVRRLKALGYSPGFELTEAAYDWLSLNHAGQWSWEYEALCRLGRVYTPGPLRVEQDIQL